MKKIFSALLLAFVLSAAAQKTTSGLLFCTSVNEKFQPVDATAEITLKDNKANVLFYYWNDITPRTTQLTYKTYSLDKSGKETLSGTIHQTVQPGWRYVKQNAVFTHRGVYHVKVYNEAGKELEMATLTIK